MPLALNLFKNLKYAWFTLQNLGLPLMLRGLRYSLEKTQAELKYADPMQPREGLKLWWQTLQQWRQPKPAPPPFEDFTHPGRLVRWRQQDHTITLVCELASLQLTVLTPGLVRVRLSQNGAFQPAASYLVLPTLSDWPHPAFTVTENETSLRLLTAELIVHIHKNNSRIDFLDQVEQPINLDAAGCGWQGDWVGLQRQLPAEAPVFGLGAQAMPLNLRGKQYQIWQRDPGGRYEPGQTPLSQNHPWLISLNQNQAFGLLFDNSCRSYIDLGSQTNHYTISACNGELRFYFINGPTIKTVLTRLRNLTGSMPLPPLWALGLHQSRWGYKTQQAVRTIASQFRQRKIPCDVIHLDIDHLHQKRSFTWHKRHFRHPEHLTQRLREQGFRLASIVGPGIRADRLNELAEAGIKQDVFLKYPDGQLFQGPVWPGDCYFPDFTNPTARIWWGEQHQTLLEAGIAVVWNDMNEPSVFGLPDGTIPDTVWHSFENRQANHAEMHNVYGLQMARASYEGLRALQPQQRPFVMSRSGFPGIQRYAAVWTGDNQSSWTHLRLSLTMTLNLGLSGVPFAGPDIGGFYGRPGRELFARWIQLAALFPLCRIHTANGTSAQEPWSFGSKVEAIAREMMALRYQLLPYLYTAFWQASQTGMPIIRALLFDFQADPQTHSLDDQFMVGEALLVAPVLTRATTRTLYLPQGTAWIDYWTGQGYEGGQTITVEAPLEKLPLFVKAGSVLPQWPLIQHTDQAAKIAQLKLHVYPGQGDASLYEDDGQSLAYRAGGYKLTRFVCRTEATRLVVTARTEGRFSPPYQTIQWLIHLDASHTPTSIIADSLPITTWQTEEQAGTLSFETPFIQRLEIVFAEEAANLL